MIARQLGALGKAVMLEIENVCLRQLQAFAKPLSHQRHPRNDLLNCDRLSAKAINPAKELQAYWAFFNFVHGAFTGQCEKQH